MNGHPVVLVRTSVLHACVLVLDIWARPICDRRCSQQTTCLSLYWCSLSKVSRVYFDMFEKPYLICFTLMKPQWRNISLFTIISFWAYFCNTMSKGYFNNNSKSQYFQCNRVQFVWNLLRMFWCKSNTTDHHVR